MIGLLESDWAPPDADLVGEAEAGGVDATFGLADVANCRCCETLVRCCNAEATKLFPRAVGCCNGITCRKSKVLAVAMDVNAVNAGLDAILRNQCDLNGAQVCPQLYRRDPQPSRLRIVLASSLLLQLFFSPPIFGFLSAADQKFNIGFLPSSPQHCNSPSTRYRHIHRFGNLYGSLIYNDRDRTP